MANPQESNVPVPPGQDIRAMQITVLDAGVPTTVLMQVIQIADEWGNPFQFEHQEDWRREVLDELRAIRLGIQELTSGGALPGDAQDLIEMARELRTDPDQQN